MSIGPLKSGKTVRDAAKATLQLWLPSVLAEVETAYGLADGSLPAPAPHAYHLVARTESLLPVTARPAVIIATPDKELSRRGTGRFDAVFSLLVTVLAGGKSFEDTIDNADFYALAVEAALTQHPTLAPYGDDPVAQGVVPVGHSYGPVGEGDRTVMRATVGFAVRVTDVLSATEGPLEPAGWDAPYDLDTLEVVVERMED